RAGARLHAPLLAAGQPAPDVVGEAALRLLAVVDEVEPELHLPFDAVLDGAPDPPVEVRRHGPPLLTGGDHLGQPLVPGQRALVRDADPAVTSPHLTPPRRRSLRPVYTPSSAAACSSIPGITNS